MSSKSPFAAAAAHTLSIGVLLGLSIATFAYERTLLPLYGAAATRHHLNKVIWGAAIVGMFAPSLPPWPAFVGTGTLLCIMPQTAYWAAVYTGRMGDAIWGPVITHLSVLAPALCLGFSVVKELQASFSHAWWNISVANPFRGRKPMMLQVSLALLCKPSVCQFVVWPS